MSEMYKEILVIHLERGADPFKPKNMRDGLVRLNYKTLDESTSSGKFYMTEADARELLNDLILYFEVKR